MSIFLDHIDTCMFDSQVELEFELDPPVVFRDYQKNFIDSLLSGKFSRFYLLWCARAGKDLTCFYIVCFKALSNPGTTYTYVLPTMEMLIRVIVNGTLDDGRRLFSLLPRNLIAKMNEKAIFFSNGSVIFFLASDRTKGDVLAGKTWDGVVLSEFALMAHPGPLMKVLTPRLNKENDKSFIIINTTPRGNLGYSFEEWNKHQEAGFFSSKVTIDMIFPKKFIDAYIKRAGMDDFSIKRELYCDFYAPVEGAIYGDLIENFKYKKISDEEKRELLDSYTVFIGMDLGFKRDPCALWFFVLNKDGEFIFIDFKMYYCSSLFDILEEVLFNYSNTYFFLPHDSDRGDGSSVKDRFLERGIPHMVLERTNSVIGDIKSMVRPFFNERKVFFLKNKNVEKGLAYLKSYRTKDNGFVHHGSDGASDAADALRYAVVGAYKHVALSQKRL